ncbi:MAG: DUF2851 family protein [Bacteroidota bacterium]|nr:DUF2851 family protein [Bacteroidota bacterium]
MTEDFLSFLWQYKLYNPNELFADGEKIEVLHPGERNVDAGPDFFNTKIKIGETVWAGNAEIHRKATDWNLHGHDKNPAFDNVILHVTAQNDGSVYTSKGRKLQTIELAFDSAYWHNYNSLLVQPLWIPCAGQIAVIDPFIISSWLSKLGIERLESRTTSILNQLEKTNNDWEEIFFRQIARSFGFHVNSLPFEALANVTPYIIVKKCSHDITQIEALLFGQAGFLHDDYSDDEYYRKLKSEYNFLRAKYDLTPIDTHLWKFLRLRPGNFPTIRLAQFAAFLHRNPSFFSSIIDAAESETLIEMLTANISDYWKVHYTFGDESQLKSKSLGRNSACTILINTVIPFYFVYAKKLGLPQFQDRAMQLLESLDAETNSVITGWAELGVNASNAFDSQALLQLKNEYCEKKRCLECAIGSKLICRK